MIKVNFRTFTLVFSFIRALLIVADTIK